MIPQVHEAVDLPVVPIGGIGADNIADVLAAGANRVAVASSVMMADDPKAAAADLKKRLTSKD